MSVTRLKRAVTRFFGSRRRELAKLDGYKVRPHDDFLELYVLARLAKTADSVSFEQLQGSGATKRFVVATSPTTGWERFSYLNCVWNGSAYAARTGLSVGTAKDRHTTEIDVIVLTLPTTWKAPATIPASAVVVGFECKAHHRTIQLPHANETIGKTFRIWPTGVPRRSGGGTATASYCVVTWSGAATSARETLEDHGIAHAQVRVGVRDEFGTHVRGLASTL